MTLMATSYIEHGSPWENPFVESFNGHLRDELLNIEEFGSITEAKVLIEDWLQEYDNYRPRSALGAAPQASTPSPQSRTPKTDQSTHSPWTPHRTRQFSTYNRGKISVASVAKINAVPRSIALRSPFTYIPVPAVSTFRHAAAAGSDATAPNALTARRTKHSMPIRLIIIAFDGPMLISCCWCFAIGLADSGLRVKRWARNCLSLDCGALTRRARDRAANATARIYLSRHIGRRASFRLGRSTRPDRVTR
jgi:hypothetical protein